MRGAVSRRYPHEVTCPDCELKVQGNEHTGRIRPHVQRAIDAGRPHADCVKRTRMIRNFRRGR